MAFDAWAADGYSLRPSKYGEYRIPHRFLPAGILGRRVVCQQAMAVPAGTGIARDIHTIVLGCTYSVQHFDVHRLVFRFVGNDVSGSADCCSLLTQEIGNG
jgi:hypothetical protein